MTETNELKKNAGRILSHIRELEDRYGREVICLAASKTRNKEEIAAVIEAGVAVFGENRADELCRKYEEGAYGDARLDFIGTLQSNKVRVLVGKAALIHSLCTESAAAAIERAAGKMGLRQKVLIEIHVGSEESKRGLPLREAEAFAEGLRKYPHVDLRGFMCVPPLGEDPTPYFEAVAALYERLKPVYALDTLSMGMTRDYEKAVAAGSNLIRIGTALFGERKYPG